MPQSVLVKIIFQLTRPRKARLLSCTISVSAQSFQLTRPRKARLSISILQRPIYNFNSRAHARRDVLVYWQTPKQAHFNSRAHARRDFFYFNFAVSQNISTHAPTQGATIKRCHIRSQFCISTHAPTQGATVLHRLIPVPNVYFNSRAHARRDTIPSNPLILLYRFQLTRPRKARQMPSGIPSRNLS